jgi:hypothetical protein
MTWGCYGHVHPFPLEKRRFLIEITKIAMFDQCLGIGFLGQIRMVLLVDGDSPAMSEVYGILGSSPLLQPSRRMGLAPIISNRLMVSGNVVVI